MHTHFALVGGSHVERQAVAEKLMLDQGHIRLNIAKDVGARLTDRDAWFIERLPQLEALRLFDTDAVVVEDVEFDHEAHVLRDMGFRVIHCGSSSVTREPEDLAVTVAHRSVAVVGEFH